MIYLRAALSLLALLSGASSVTVALFVYLQRRKLVVLHFAGFLGSLWLILASLSMYLLADIDPDTRRLVQLTLEPGNNSHQMFDLLLAKNRSADRKGWLEKNGNLADI